MARNEIRRVGVIGYPIRHSLSPVFQQAAFDFHAIPARYEAWEVPPGKLGEMIGTLRDGNSLGANVTVPHKQTVMALLDEIDPMAMRVGAVNTIVNRNRTLVGFNTDVFGFLNALRQEAAYSLNDKRVVIVGAGGVARAVGYALIEGGAASISVANRSVERAERLVADLSKQVETPGRLSIRALGTSREELAEIMGSADLLVNATSVGMLHSGLERELPLPANLLHPHLFVYDLVYNPPRTALLEAAIEHGATVLNGLSMLIYQGAAAFELWTGRDAPVGLMMARALERLP